MDFIQWLNKNKGKLIFWGAILVFSPILIIHILFSIYTNNNWIIAKWEAGEILNYFGAIIGACATIVAFVGTIIFTIYYQKEQTKNSIKPYLQTDYRDLYKYNDISTAKQRGKLIDFYKYEGKVMTHSPYKLPFEIEDETEFEARKKELLRKHHIIEYNIKNVGAGSAVKIKWTLNDQPIIPDFAISKDDVSKFIITIDSNLLEDDKKILSLRFEFDDVMGLSRYSQVEEFEFVRNEYGMLFINQRDDGLISTPKSV